MKESLPELSDYSTRKKVSQPSCRFYLVRFYFEAFEPSLKSELVNNCLARLNQSWQVCYRVFLLESWVAFSGNLGAAELACAILKAEGFFCLTIEGVANIAKEVRDSQNTVARGFGSAIHTAVSVGRGRSCSG